MAGLMAGRRLLERGIEVTMLDKGRGPGGRMATRFFGDAVLDHGAQFITVRDETFRRHVEAWLDEGGLVEWSRGFDRADGKPVADRFPHYRGRRGMHDVPRRLARNLPLKSGERATAVVHDDQGWFVQVEGGDPHRADALLLTPPVPQSLELVGSLLPREKEEALRAIEYAPCIAVLARLTGPSRLEEPGALRMPGEPLEWMADNHLKGISPDAHAVTLHAGPAFSRSHWDHELEATARTLLEAAAPWIGTGIEAFQVHRWRYSKPVRLHHEAFLTVEDPYPLVFAGDAFNGPRVEGAALSGLAAADHLADLLA
jgi:predicted NAD/FAD-dependent oxidoreductase